jgi:hypothetical protein
MQLYFDISGNSTSKISMKVSAADLLPLTFHISEDAKDSTSYLPIRPLPPDQDQTVFGMPFFQAACMLTNYETDQFYLTARSQHRETQTNPGTFISIRSLKTPEPSDSDKAEQPRRGNDIKRTIIEVVLGVFALCVIGFLFWWGRKRRKHAEQKVVPTALEKDGTTVHEMGMSAPQVHEVEGTGVSARDGSTLVGSENSGLTQVSPPDTINSRR